MDLFINGTQIDYQTEGEKTVGEILGSIESTCEKEGMTITGIRADGRDIPASELDELFAGKAETVEKIELATINGDDVKKMLRELGENFTDCATLLRDIPIQLQTGKDLQVMETINRFSTQLQELYRLIPLLSITGIPANEPAIDGVALNAFPSELTPLLTDLLDGLKNKDTVLVGDLSEYELAPRIEHLGAALISV